MGRFELSHDSRNTWKINSDLADYANKHIKTFVSNNTSIEVVLIVNHIPSNINEDVLYLWATQQNLDSFTSKKRSSVKWNTQKLILRRKIR